MMGFVEHLSHLKEKNRYRQLSLPRGIDLSSNDYLKFCDHPDLKAAAIEALHSDVSLGAGASRLLRGHHRAHEALERYAALFFGAQKALYFAGGFQANVAFFQTVPSRHDVIIFDSLTHASARDGIQASLAKHYRVGHNDLDAFEVALKNARSKNAQKIFIAVESLYSMDGDFALLADLYALAQKYDAYLVVDEAHATGVYGDKGRGLVSELPSHERVISLHTCGKAVGVFGGLLCADGDIIDYMINKARPFIYATAPPPFLAHMVHKALELCASEVGDAARLKLLNLIEYARSKNVCSVSSQIIPFIIGDDKAAIEAATKMQAAGYDIRAIRPPTVPEGTARLRLSLNANLTTDILDDVFELLKTV